MVEEADTEARSVCVCGWRPETYGASYADGSVEEAGCSQNE